MELMHCGVARMPCLPIILQKINELSVSLGGVKKLDVIDNN
jgi:hypothetical protein